MLSEISSAPSILLPPEPFAAAVKELPAPSPSVTDLSEEEVRQVAELKARDREVRAHEQAHKNVGGQYAGAISYEYQRGPDGQNYAIGGEVPIDVAPEGTPEETIAKLQVVIRAALAPAEPSAQDRRVAAEARSKLAAAQAELRAAPAENEAGGVSEADKARAAQAVALDQYNQFQNILDGTEPQAVSTAF